MDAGTGGVSIQPVAAQLPRGWGWNVFRITSNQSKSWHFEMDGDATGSAGAPALFEVRLVARNADGTSVVKMVMIGGQDGVIDYVSPALATELYLVVVAVPQFLRGSQTYSYGVKIDRT